MTKSAKENKKKKKQNLSIDWVFFSASATEEDDYGVIVTYRWCHCNRQEPLCTWILVVGVGRMTISLTRFKWSMWGRRKQKAPVSKASALNSSLSSKCGIAKEIKKAPPHREVERRKEERRVDREVKRRKEERRVDREYDVVLVPSDDDWCLSGSESDDSDWSIGWMEPFGSDFSSSDSFAVLVPCYTPGSKEVEALNKALLGASENLFNEFSSDGKRVHMEEWLASLQNFEA
ncbi:hypothetical protein CR513_12418, partial [Mucuna pruriens]